MEIGGTETIAGNPYTTPTQNPSAPSEWRPSKETLAFVDNQGIADSIWAKTTIVPLPVRNELSTPNWAGSPTGRAPLNKESFRYLAVHGNPSRVSSHESVATSGEGTLPTTSSMSAQAFNARLHGVPGALRLPVHTIRAKIASGVRPAAESTPFPGRRLDFSAGPAIAQELGAMFTHRFPSGAALAPSALLTTTLAVTKAGMTTKQLVQVMTPTPGKWPETSWDHPSAYLRGLDHHSARRVTAMP